MADDEQTTTTRAALSKARMEAFSDGVMAIAITLLVLDLAVRPPGSPLEQFLRGWPAYFVYLVSFLTIGAAWIGHSSLTDDLDHVDRIFLRLNLLFLLSVSFLPFPTRLVGEALERGTSWQRVAVDRVRAHGAGDPLVVRGDGLLRSTRRPTAIARPTATWRTRRRSSASSSASMWQRSLSACWFPAPRSCSISPQRCSSSCRSGPSPRRSSEAGKRSLESVRSFIPPKRPAMNAPPTDPAPGGAGPPRHSRVPARGQKAAAKGAAVAKRGRLWIENQPPDSRKGATIGWVRRYQASNGQLFAVLLSAYLLLTLIPVFLVTASYSYKDPTALADRIEHRLRLRGTTAQLFSSVMVGTGEHKISAVLIAIIDLFFFGLGFPRVLQIVHARSWGIDLGKSVLADQARYVEVLVALVLGAALFVGQTRALRGEPSWIGWFLDPRLARAAARLLHLGAADLAPSPRPDAEPGPGAVFTVLGFVILRLISALLLTHWLNWYSTTYGAFGIIIAIFFWLILIGTVLVLAAALSPAFAQRRDLLEAHAEDRS